MSTLDGKTVIVIGAHTAIYLASNEEVARRLFEFSKQLVVCK